MITPRASSRIKLHACTPLLSKPFPATSPAHPYICPILLHHLIIPPRKNPSLARSLARRLTARPAAPEGTCTRRRRGPRRRGRWRRGRRRWRRRRWRRRTRWLGSRTWAWGRLPGWGVRCCFRLSFFFPCLAGVEEGGPRRGGRWCGGEKAGEAEKGRKMDGKKYAPSARGYPRACRPGSRAPRRCVLRPRTPRSHPGRPRRGGLPRHHCCATRQPRTLCSRAQCLFGESVGGVGEMLGNRAAMRGGARRVPRRARHLSFFSPCSGNMKRKWERRNDVRVLVHEAARVVHLVVDHDVEVLLGGVRAHVRVGECLVGHFVCVRCRCVWEDG